MLLSHSVRPGLCQQSRAGRRHPWKRRVAGVQTQSVAQTADNVEEERQTDTAQQEVQQISPAASGDRRRSNDKVLCLEGKSWGGGLRRFLEADSRAVVWLLVQTKELWL